jgi:hypothetical protein
VRVDARIPRRSCQILAFSEWDVLSIRVFVAFSQAEVDDEHTVLVLLGGSNQEIVWLDISVDNSLFVRLLNS